MFIEINPHALGDFEIRCGMCEGRGGFESNQGNLYYCNYCGGFGLFYNPNIWDIRNTDGERVMRWVPCRYNISEYVQENGPLDNWHMA